MSTPAPQTGEILPGVWRFTATHPEWVAGEDWEPEVAWWALASEDGLLLIDPLPTDWESLDELVEALGGCAGVIRTMHFHQRAIPEAASRYRAPVWARLARSDGRPQHPLDRALEHAEEPTPGVTAYHVPRDDELVIWLKVHRALIAGDVLLRDERGTLQRCPDSWLRRDGGPEPLKATLRDLDQLGAAHVLVSHGPHVLADGRELARLAK